ncbi:hypothetical protein [Chelativorans xinjiangense]|uniref:hypothetical protein n=1 Tax=Chelativorans xinjiangense TaxID=2681485 RepID=UPI001359C944|nr:hypothetical protein [Chelativorans xinjiangense]
MNQISARSRRVSDQASGENRTLQPDFRVEYSTAVGWQIAIVSQRASEWARENARSPVFNNNGGFIQTDLAGVNLLVHGSRQDGLSTEYIGPQRILRF